MRSSLGGAAFQKRPWCRVPGSRPLPPSSEPAASGLSSSFVSGQLISNLKSPFPGNATHRFQSLGRGHPWKAMWQCGASGVISQQEGDTAERDPTCVQAPCSMRAAERGSQRGDRSTSWGATTGLLVVWPLFVETGRLSCVCVSPPQKGQRGRRGSRRVPVLSREWQPQPTGLLLPSLPELGLRAPGPTGGTGLVILLQASPSSLLPHPPTAALS